MSHTNDFPSEDNPPENSVPLKKVDTDVDRQQDYVKVTGRKKGLSLEMEVREPTRSPKNATRQPGSLMSGVKRRRSPATCGHCLRTTHKTEECRHLLTCKRCGGAGHMAVGCRVELPPSPRQCRVRLAAKARRSPPAHHSELLDRREGGVVDRTHPHKVHVSISLTQETSKLRKELAKIVVLDVISGQTNDEILLEFLPGALNTPRVDAVYEFRGSSFLATLCSEEEAIRASKIGELSLPSRLGQYVFSISLWTAEVGSVGAASGKGQVLLIWNLPLHAWTWTVLVGLL